MRNKFKLQFAPEAAEHVRSVEKKYYHLIQDTLKSQLSYEPNTETRNRKPLVPPAPWGATWELRFGPSNRFRAFYEFDEAERIVWVLAIAVKEGNRLFVGGKEMKL